MPLRLVSAVVFDVKNELWRNVVETVPASPVAHPSAADSATRLT